MVVVGATGGVGRLVTQRLLAACETPDEKDSPLGQALNTLPVTKVRALVRNASRAHSALPCDNPALSIFEMGDDSHTTGKDDRPSPDYKGALQDAAALVICMGTTAFPTKAWQNGNTPTAVDDKLIDNLVHSIDANTMQRLVHVSSIGTGRTREFPFLILNSFGILDAKARGEQHVRQAAQRHNIAYSIVRPGRLVGEPHTNVGMLRSDPNPRALDVTVAAGDNLRGELSRVAAADAVLLATRWDTDHNLDFSVVHTRGTAPPTDKWVRLLQAVAQTEPSLANADVVSP